MERHHDGAHDDDIESDESTQSHIEPLLQL